MGGDSAVDMECRYCDPTGTWVTLAVQVPPRPGHVSEKDHWKAVGRRLALAVLIHGAR